MFSRFRVEGVLRGRYGHVGFEGILLNTVFPVLETTV